MKILLKIFIWLAAVLVAALIAALVITILTEIGLFSAILAAVVVVLATSAASFTATGLCRVLDKHLSIFNQRIKPNCSYCRNGAFLGFDEVACSKRGIMSEDGNCNAFYYEPTKRKPEYAKAVAISKYSEEDMKV